MKYIHAAVGEQLIHTTIPERKGMNRWVQVLDIDPDGVILTSAGKFDREGYGVNVIGKVRHVRKVDGASPVTEHTCGDCGCKEGQLHTPGCDMEICPFCGGQLLSCDCVYDLLGIRNPELYTEETAYLPPDIYKNGLTPEQTEAWEALLEAKGLIPYIYYPLLCGRCGQHWPAFFRVPDEEWQKHIDPAHRKLILCYPCYEAIKVLIDKGADHANAVSS